MTVFDSSALIAFLKDEPGATTVMNHLVQGGWCSAANWSEVAQKISAADGDWPAARLGLLSFGLTIEPVTIGDAEAAAALWPSARSLSLADRLCLVLGSRVDEEIVTADRAWEGYSRVLVIR
jgi:PIN domain nuclease of toxin-antitoxin system